MPILEMQTGGPTAVEFMLHAPCLRHDFYPVTAATDFSRTAKTVACNLIVKF